MKPPQLKQHQLNDISASIQLFIYLSIDPSIHIYVYPFTYLYLCLSTYLQDSVDGSD